MGANRSAEAKKRRQEKAAETFEIRRRMIQEAHNRGIPCEDIAKKLGLRATSVRDILSKDQ